MNKFERFAVNHHLSDYPQDYELIDIISDVLAESENISVYELYENVTPQGLAEYIEDMVNELESVFSD